MVQSPIREQLFYRQEPIDGGRLPFTTREQDRYSICAAIQAQLTSDWTDAGFERECSRSIAQQLNREPGPGGFFLPSNLSMKRAAYTTGTASQGGNVVATNLLASSFIESLVNALVVQQTGCTVLSGLVGNVDVPRRASRASAYWVSEGGAITESEGTFDKVQLRPKQVGALSTFTRLMIQQGTPDIEMLVRSDLVTILGQAIDYAALFGTGTNNQPLGLFNQSGVATYAMGTNGGALSDLDPMISLRAKVAAANADASRGAFVVNEVTRAALMKLKTSYGEYLFSVEGQSPSTVPNLFGNNLYVSNQLPSNLTKGTATSKCSAAIFGDFSQLIMGMWGATEVMVNPYGSGFSSGNVDVRAMQTVDFAIRHPESFTICTDIIA